MFDLFGLLGWWGTWGHGSKVSHLALLPGLKEMRLLELTTARSARLFNVPVDSAPPYFGLSYAWGDPTPVAAYTVNDDKILISQSLSGALARVFAYSSAQETKQPFYLWADAICIDQNNDQEKASQVALMSRIYSKASQVLVYLGEDGFFQSSKQALDIINIWAGRNLEYKHAHEKWEYCRASRTITRDQFLKLSGLADNPALYTFFSRPWWNRVWTLQELYFSHDATFLCGRHQIEWSAIAKAVEVWLDGKTMSAHRAHREILAAADFMAGGLALKIAAKQLSPQGCPWLSLLVSTTNFASTDPRDRLYALANMCNELPGFEISYTKPVAVVYKDFVKGLISHTNSLELLQLAGVNHEPSLNPLNLPSWIPNFANLNHPILVYHKLLNSPSSQEHMRNSFQIWTASPFGVSLQEPTSDSDFRPKGLQVGTVDEVDSLPSQSGWIPKAYTRFGTRYEPPTMDCHILEAVFRTIMGDRYDNANKRLPEYEDRFQLAGEFWHIIREDEFFTSMLQKMNISGGVDQILLGEQAKSKIEVKSGRFTREVVPTMKTKFDMMQFFITSNGYMGYGPACQVGDVVCIVFGCSVPLLLRALGNGYVIVGQCFVLGIMNGELFEHSTKAVDEVDGVQVFDIF